MDATSANVIAWHEKLLVAALAANKANPDFKFNLRISDTTDTDRLSGGYWFTGTDKYLFFAPFQPHDQNNKSRTIGFVINFDGEGNPDRCSLQVVFSSTTDSSMRAVYQRTVDAVGGFEKARTDNYRKVYPSSDPMVAFKAFLEEDYPRLRVIIHESGKDDEFLISDTKFQVMLNRIMTLRGSPARAAGQTKLTVSDASRYLESRYGLRREPSQKMAGFENPSGRQLALEREGDVVRLFLEPGDWEAPGVRLRQTYAPADGRHSNLLQQAPKLANGHPACLVWVTTLSGLKSLCDEYDGSTPSVVTTESNLMAPTKQPLNQILYGPPGTGKTYRTVDKALAILDSEFLRKNADNRAALRNRFEVLRDEGRIRFVTFHQSFSYEDFVEGIRADSSEGQLRYEVAPGVFKEMCAAAGARVTRQTTEAVDVEGRRIWKMSLGNTLTDGDSTFQECLDSNSILLGYGDDIDFTACKTRQEVRQQFERYDVASSGKDSYAVTAVSKFILEIKKGDLVVVSDGNHKFRGIAEVTGDYRFLKDDSRDGYWQCRDVRWLRAYNPSLPRDQLMNNAFSQMTLYELRPGSIDIQKLAGLLNSDAGSTGVSVGDMLGNGYRVSAVTSDVLRLEKPNGSKLSFDRELLEELAGYVRDGRVTLDDIRQRKVFEKVNSRLEKYIISGYENILPVIVERMLARPPQPAGEQRWVLVIDEINRGNISKIFGELITLLEADKRKGGAEAVTVRLPYSQSDFSVPNNLYIIGTMNTADRSLASLDIALRRRFIFEEVAPDPKLLAGINVADTIPMDKVLEAMNQRIHLLLNRDHMLGHSYFLPLKKEPTLEKLAEIFRVQILPLLEEYFFEDWGRIRWVLNDHRKDVKHQFVIKPTLDATSLLGETVDLPVDKHWEKNGSAFIDPASYMGIIGK